MTTLRILAFGDLATETWGASWIIDGPGPVRVAVAIASEARLFEAELSEGAENGWRLEGDSASLAFQAAGPPIVSHDPQGHLERHDQLCQVDARIQTDGRETELGCLGWMSLADGAPELADFESVRFLAAWLGPSNGFSLTAVRPRKAHGQEADVVAAALVDEPLRVVDPRLSTTYTDLGTPARAGLELWLEPENGDAQDEESVQYPRRAGGEARGASHGWEQGELALHASLLRWRSQGQEGPGVYLLGRRR